MNTPKNILLIGVDQLRSDVLGADKAVNVATSNTDQLIANQILEELGDSEQPFFLHLQYWDPHGLHLLPDQYYGKTDRDDIRAWASFSDDLAGKPVRVKRERDDFYRLHPRSEEEVIEYIGLYCDHVAMLDAKIGRLLERLNEVGLAESTLVIFTSDHGDMTGSHGGLIDKGFLYEEAMRVPLVFTTTRHCSRVFEWDWR